MTCRSARREMADLIDEPVSMQLASHLKTCDACTAHHQQLADTLVRIQPVCQVRASLDFKERTMKKLANELAAAEAAKPYRQPHPVWRLAFSAGLVLAIVLALPYLGDHSKSGAVSLLAQSVEALGGMHSVHITARMRTVPGDNFELIGTQYEFVPLEMWKEFGSHTSLACGEPGRIVVMDGKQSLMLMNRNHAVHGGVREFHRVAEAASIPNRCCRRNSRQRSTVNPTRR